MSKTKSLGPTSRKSRNSWKAVYGVSTQDRGLIVITKRNGLVKEARTPTANIWILFYCALSLVNLIRLLRKQAFSFLRFAHGSFFLSANLLCSFCFTLKK